MILDFWAKTSGTWINIFTVLIGTSFGLVWLYRTYDVKLTGKSQVKKHLRLKSSKFLKL